MVRLLSFWFIKCMHNHTIIHEECKEKNRVAEIYFSKLCSSVINFLHWLPTMYANNKARATRRVSERRKTIKILHTHIALLKSVPFIATNESKNKKKKRENEKKSDFSRAGKAGSHKAAVRAKTSENHSAFSLLLKKWKINERSKIESNNWFHRRERTAKRKICANFTVIGKKPERKVFRFIDSGGSSKFITSNRVLRRRKEKSLREMLLLSMVIHAMSMMQQLTVGEGQYLLFFLKYYQIASKHSSTMKVDSLKALRVCR